MRHPIKITRAEVRHIITHATGHSGQLIGERWVCEDAEDAGDIYTTPARWVREGKAICEDMGMDRFARTVVAHTIMRNARY